jgi:hypothetical protein
MTFTTGWSELQRKRVNVARRFPTYRVQKWQGDCLREGTSCHDP